jgi:hypothetical protein
MTVSLSQQYPLTMQSSNIVLLSDLPIYRSERQSTAASVVAADVLDNDVAAAPLKTTDTPADDRSCFPQP